jgi:hypothetical protein
VNNAVYDYMQRCSRSDLDITEPPHNLRIWLFHNLEASSAVMMHHGAFLKNDLVAKFLRGFAPLVEIFAPDITLGMEGKEDYREIYSTTCHELAHASHFAKVGNIFWDEYIKYIMVSYAKTGGMTYGDGTTEGAGYCEIGEMWGYYMENKMYKDRYGGAFPTFGTSYWFSPQIFRYLDERGLRCSEICEVLDQTVVSRSALKDALILSYPSKRDIVEQVFSRYR